MIYSRQCTSHSNRAATAYTMVEMLVVIALVVGLAAMLLGLIGRQGGEAEKKMRYLQNRDALVAVAKWHRWNYINGDPRAPRQIEELEFDGSAVKDDDLHYLWENIQPHFPHREKMFDLNLMSFNDTEFADGWMTNLIGIDQTGYPYRAEGLKKLNLEQTLISDVGLRMLYQHVPELQPDSPNIQAELDSTYAMTNLLEINVYGCEKVTEQGIADLKKALPNIKVTSTFDPYP